MSDEVYYVVEMSPDLDRSIAAAFSARENAESFADKRWEVLGEGWSVYVVEGRTVFKRTKAVGAES
jgi:hypothetical protein